MNKKFFLIAGGISLFILILVLIFSPKKNLNPAGPAQRDDSRAQPESERPELIDLARDKRQQTMIYVESIEKKLPLYLENFKTSVGITTSINIYRASDDEAEIVRLEIYGLSYLNSDSNETKNPNVTAYKESYAKSLEMLESQNIDPKKLIFIYGDKEYVRQTSEAWIYALKLQP
jgi:hypothetical protein